MMGTFLGGLIIRIIVFGAYIGVPLFQETTCLGPEGLPPEASIMEMSQQCMRCYPSCCGCA